MENFAQVILPIPIYNTYTYAIPGQFKGQLSIGSRVLVQFGRQGFYTAIIVELHNRAPVGYDVKPITMLLDNHPIVLPIQLKLWNWISDYYLCAPGEVMKAALPSGLKVESETYVSLNRDYEYNDSIIYNEREATLIQFLDSYKRIRISEIERENLMSEVKHTINSLLEKGILLIDERLTNKYVAQKRSYVKLTCPLSDRESLHHLFDLVGKARKQEALLLSYIELAGAPSSSSPEIERSQLLNRADASSAILKAMVDKGIFYIIVRDVNRFDRDASSNIVEVFPKLSSNQEFARKQILHSWKNNNICLLHGVTGSGKTEIYSTLIRDTIAEGKQVLFLVPEISLTTQLTSRLRRIFGDNLIVYHSRFSDNERVDIWKKLLISKEPLLVLGVRSSVFLPFYNLGLVIVDEEHEASYKQYDPAPRYNARDAALVLARMYGAKALLGSATPSIETYSKALSGKYGLAEVLTRYEGMEMPEVEIVDMRDQRKRKQNSGVFSRPLLTYLHRFKDEHAQSILFQNRRGFAPMVNCRQCGWTPRCPNCDVTPVFHKHTAELRCHYCGQILRLPKLCPACGENELQIFGYGTERVAEDLEKVMPHAKIERMDFDTTRNKNSYQEIISRFSDKETDILVGTQMVSKGLDFENVRLVGVLNADTLLNFPDFRSEERAYNMLEQVSGRAGRHKMRGKVIIQTTDPTNPILEFVRRHDYKSYYKMQISERKRFGYPPFTKVINILLKHRDRSILDELAQRYVVELRRIFGNRVLGPERPFVSRISTYHLQSVMLKVEANASMKKVKKILRDTFETMSVDKRFKTLTIHYDVDPM